jgi:hypothetical protein
MRLALQNCAANKSIGTKFRTIVIFIVIQTKRVGKLLGSHGGEYEESFLGYSVM